MRNAFRILMMALLIVALPAGVVFATGGGEQESSTGMSSSDGEYNEAPMLAAMVASGDLPPVEERLPVEPAVRDMVEGVGNYGGTMSVLAINNAGWGADMDPTGYGSSAFRVSADGVGLEPNIALSLDINDDGTEALLTLREGVKYSDGDELTTEDIRFTIQDMHRNPNVSTWVGSANFPELEIIDDYRIRLIRPTGIAGFKLEAASWVGGSMNLYSPSHYLKQFHIDYNEDADELAQENGFDNWYEYFNSQAAWAPRTNLDYPDLTAWVQSRRTPNAIEYTRNPYYWAVDTAGNQLPYIDRIQIAIVDQEVYQLRVVSGDIDVAYSATSLSNISLYRQNEDSGDYTTILWPSTQSGTLTIDGNHLHHDPAKAAYMNEADFHVALSHAIDRDEINEVMYFGLGTPRALVPIPSVSFYEPEWEMLHATYDPEMANELLDELGLTSRNSDGFRTTSDGTEVSVILEYHLATVTPAMELIKEYWESVGVKTTISLGDGVEIEERMLAGEFDYVFDFWPQPGDERTLYGSAWVWDNSGYRDYWRYLNSMEPYIEEENGGSLPNGWQRMRPESSEWVPEGQEPPEWFVDWHILRATFGQYTPGTAEYEEAGKQMWGVFADRLMGTGLVGLVPQPTIVKNNVGNFPRPPYLPVLPMGADLVPHFADQLYFK